MAPSKVKILPSLVFLILLGVRNKVGVSLCLVEWGFVYLVKMELVCLLKFGLVCAW